MAQRVSNLATKAVYGVITPEIIRDICDRRLLAAALLSKADDRATSHAATMVLYTVEAIRNELLEMIS